MRRLQCRRVLYRVVVESQPAYRGGSVWYDCVGPGDRSVWFDPVEAPGNAEGCSLLVEATLRRVVHPAVTGADGSRLPPAVEYRLTGAVVPGRRARSPAAPP